MSDWFDARGRSIARHSSFGLMGIINVTPDSFYDGGRFFSVIAVLSHAEELLQAGCDILDIGAESTRPGALAIDATEEWHRLEPALVCLRQHLPEAVLSVDTRRASVAAKAIAAGATIINDISGCVYDTAMADVLAQYKPAYVLMHSKGLPENMQDKPRYDNVVEEINAFFEKQLNMLVRNGLPENRIALDPGIGFGKTLSHNLEIMRRMSEFLNFGRPLLAGISMKSFLGKLFHLPVQQRASATATTSALLFSKGVVWHRVHEPASVKIALELAEALNMS